MLEHMMTSRVTKIIVDGFELIEINMKQDAVGCAAVSIQQVCEVAVQRPPICDARQNINIGRFFGLLSRVFERNG